MSACISVSNLEPVCYVWCPGGVPLCVSVCVTLACLCHPVSAYESPEPYEIPCSVSVWSLCSSPAINGREPKKNVTLAYSLQCYDEQEWKEAQQDRDLRFQGNKLVSYISSLQLMSTFTYIERDTQGIFNLTTTPTQQSGVIARIYL